MVKIQKTCFQPNGWQGHILKRHGITVIPNGIFFQWNVPFNIDQKRSEHYWRCLTLDLVCFSDMEMT